MKTLFLVLASLFFNNSFSEDLGKFGRLYKISEISPLVMITEKAQEMVDSGRWAEIQESKKGEILKYLMNPPSTSLPKAMEYRKIHWDSTYQVENDIYTKEGRLIARAGDIIRPTDYRRMLKQYCFFDLNDEMQIKWVELNCSNIAESKVIAVDGEYMKYAEIAKFPVFFDQYGKLVERFKIKRLPSIVRQIGNEIYVEEYPTN
jgi:conjugal transfer pilus assembly protein TraW